MPEDEITGIGLAAALHDIGKIYIPEEIRNSNVPLKEWQQNVIRDHPEVGFNILKSVELKTPGFPWPIAEIVLQHHERLDGSGYPQGLSGEEILLGARILAVADVVAAMTSDRPYRPTPGIEKAMEEIITNRQQLFDPDVVDACVDVVNEGLVNLA
jgi:HD-GYP domain-containing protein (c-di-GMP phosphodiesterase class II)